MATEETGKTGILTWRGLLDDLTVKERAVVFGGLFVLSAAMTFLQFGFVGIGTPGHYIAYLLVLLAPVTGAALLLGKEWGLLEGVLAGTVLYGHAMWQPLDIVEQYFVTPLSSIVMYGVLGLLLGLFLAIALRNDPQGKRRIIYMGIVCLLVSIVATFAFFLTVVMRTLELDRMEYVFALVGTGSDTIQVIGDFVLMFAVCILADRAAQWYYTTRIYVSVRTIFRVRLLVALFLVFLVLSSAGFAGITIIERGAADENIKSELDYLNTQFAHRLTSFYGLNERAKQTDIPDDFYEYLVEMIDPGDALDGYTFEDGTVVVFAEGTVAYSYNDAYKEDASFEDLFGADGKNTIIDLAESDQMKTMLYSTGGNQYELGYMRAIKPMDDVYIMMAQPFSMVFEHRSETILWTSLLSLALLVVVYVVTARLLRRAVIGPVDRTNASLGKITMGDLDETVTEVGSVEFASLSAGINTTVDSLKVLIDEAERRNEKDLATAKAIQEGALPHVYPAFPAVENVNLFASMDAAKEVGGDFYDFFEVDDHTVAFLIADVSGKGIPGALFMMAAKAEIQNYLSSGVEPAKAIAAANAYLCANNEAGMFVTVWAATLDWTTGELTYVNAAHNFPLLRHGKGGSWEWLKKKCGLFLGTFDFAKYRQETLTLKPGDQLILYTDGVNEAFSIDGEEYSNPRLEAFLASHNNLSPAELVPALRDDVANWAAGAEQSDDVTIMVVEYDSPELKGDDN